MTSGPPTGTSAGSAGGAPVAPRPSPVARFLGDAEASGGPFALLRLSAGSLTDDEIIGALDAQLARLAQHRECSTPQADEVRLALHAAAAQLLDPRVRAHLIVRWGGPSAPPDAPPLERRKFPRAGSSHVALEHDAVLTLGAFGGWNKRSLGRLMALSAARGLGPADLASALRGLGGGVRRAVPEAVPAARSILLLSRLSAPLPAAPPGPEVQRAASEPAPEAFDRAEHILKLVLLCGAGGLLVLLLLAGAAVLILLRPPTTVAVPDLASTPRASQPTAPTPRAAREAQPPAPLPEEAPDIDAVTRALAASVNGFEADPVAAGTKFEGATAVLAVGWPALAPDQMIAAQHQIIEFVYRAAPTAQGARAVGAISAGAAALSKPGPMASDRVRPAVWSAGMLNRLARERDLPSGMSRQLDAALNAALGPRRPAGEQTFEAGASAAVQAIPALLVSPRAESATAGDEAAQSADLLEAWRRWVDSAERVAVQPGVRDRLLLGGLQTLLVDGPDPSADEAAFKVVRMIVAKLTWRPGDPSREWLLRWFEDGRITSADLYAVTSALATGSSAQSVNATMVVPVLASESVRSEVRDAYARAWGLTGGPDKGAVLRAIFEAADDALARDDPKRSLPEVLGSAVLLSRLNEAAGWVWKGHAEQAQAILAHLDQDVVLAPPSTRPGLRAGAIGGVRADRGWGAKYLAARKNITLRMDLISRLTDESMLDALGAELLVGDALRGTPAELRRAAGEKVMRFESLPPVVNALLEELPSVPATTANLRLIEAVSLTRVPPASDPGWMMSARRGLVERLLQLVSSEGERAMIDRQADLLARSLDERTLDTPRPVDSARGTPALPPGAELSAAILYRQWRSSVDPTLPLPNGLPGPEEVERRRAGRLALARGMVQFFAAQQISSVEMMAFVIGAERGVDAARIGAVLDQLVGERQAARHIFEQVRAAEAASLRLWMIRLGREPLS